MPIYVTDEVVLPCDTCDYAPSLCGEDIDQCFIHGRPKTPEEVETVHVKHESHFIHFVEERDMKRKEEHHE